MSLLHQEKPSICSKLKPCCPYVFILVGAAGLAAAYYLDLEMIRMLFIGLTALLGIMGIMSAFCCSSCCKK